MLTSASAALALSTDEMHPVKSTVSYQGNAMMKLTPFDRLRSQRENDFQKRVLAALEKSKRNRFLAIVNSPFFLWLASAAFLTIGGAYFASHQQCVREADLLADAYQKLAKEVLHRQEQLVDILFQAKNMTDVRNAITTPTYLYSEFRARTLYELTEDMEKIRTRVDYTAVKGGLAGLSWYPVFELENPHQYLPFFRGQDWSRYSDQDFDGLRLYATTYAFRVIPEANLGVRFLVAPRCSVSNVVGGALFGRKPKIISVETIANEFEPYAVQPKAP